MLSLNKLKTEHHSDAELKEVYRSHGVGYATEYPPGKTGCQVEKIIASMLPFHGGISEMVFGRCSLGDVLIVQDDPCVWMNVKGTDHYSFHVAAARSGHVLFVARDSDGKPLENWKDVSLSEIRNLVSSVRASFHSLDRTTFLQIDRPNEFALNVFRFTGISDWINVLAYEQKSNGDFHLTLENHAVSVVDRLGDVVHWCSSLRPPKKFRPFQTERADILPKVYGVNHSAKTLPTAFDIIQNLPPNSKVGLELDMKSPPVIRYLGSLRDSPFFTNQVDEYFSRLAGHALRYGHEVVWLERPRSHVSSKFLNLRVMFFSSFGKSFDDSSVIKSKFYHYFTRSLCIVERLAQRTTSYWRSKVMARLMLRETWGANDVVFIGAVHASDLTGVLPIDPLYLMKGNSNRTLPGQIQKMKLASGIDRIFYGSLLRGLRGLAKGMQIVRLSQKLPFPIRIIMGSSNSDETTWRNDVIRMQKEFLEKVPPQIRKGILED